MKSGYWENLRPFERRVVVAVGALFFVVLNVLFIFPYFSEWAKVDDRMFQAQRKIHLYEEEIAKTNAYSAAVKRIESQGSEVPPEDQVRHFANTIDSQAGRSGVQMISGGRTAFQTNQFFIELSRTIGVQSPEQPLVDFLYNLGASNSLIRVRDLSLRTDPQQQQLVANVTLIASYQKKTAPKPAPGGSATATSGSRSAAGGTTETTKKK